MSLIEFLVNGPFFWISDSMSFDSALNSINNLPQWIRFFRSSCDYYTTYKFYKLDGLLGKKIKLIFMEPNHTEVRLTVTMTIKGDLNEKVCSSFSSGNHDH